MTSRCRGKVIHSQIEDDPAPQSVRFRVVHFVCHRLRIVKREPAARDRYPGRMGSAVPVRIGRLGVVRDDVREMDLAERTAGTLRLPWPGRAPKRFVSVERDTYVQLR